MILEDLENFKQDLRHQEKKEKTIKQYSNYINDFIEATQIENKEDTAIIYKHGIENCKDAVERRKQEYIEKIIYWNEHLCDYHGTWADFMLK